MCVTRTGSAGGFGQPGDVAHLLQDGQVSSTARYSPRPLYSVQGRRVALFFENAIDESKYAGVLYGLGQ
eukprot:1852300-Rhodomonas_salina.1